MKKHKLLEELSEIAELIDYERHGELFRANLDECYERLVKLMEELE